MGELLLGSEALASGRLTRHRLRTRFVAIYPDVYVPRHVEVTAVVRAHGAWLWSRRQAVIAGPSAAALHRAKWVDAGRPAVLISENRRPPIGIRTWSDDIADDEIEVVDGIRVTSPARTALDIASRYPLGEAVAAIDSLARATHLKPADVDLLGQRYAGRRGVRRARAAIDLVDPGAESPRETWLRLLLVRAGFPPPQTQIPVYNGYGVLIAVVDMGWEDIKVGADYEGDHHRSRRRFNSDIRRTESLTEEGWIDVRVTVEDCEGDIIRRVEAAWARRT